MRSVPHAASQVEWLVLLASGEVEWLALLAVGDIERLVLVVGEAEWLFLLAEWSTVGFAAAMMLALWRKTQH